jgi:hypothetical protein
MESNESDVNFKYDIGQKVFYAGVPYGIMDRYRDENGVSWYLIRPFSRTGTFYSGLPVPEDALRETFREGDDVITVSEGN